MYFPIFGQDSLNGNVVNEKGAKVKFFLVKIKDKDDEQSTQHAIIGPRLWPIDKGDITKPYYDRYVTNGEMV